MDDKTLLELAAEAAGIEGEYWAGGIFYTSFLGEGILQGEGEETYVWTSLTSDGDAFRLAVKLDFSVSNWKGEAWVAPSDAPNESYAVEPHGLDKGAATRRAITRAAAEIAKAKKQL